MPVYLSTAVSIVLSFPYPLHFPPFPLPYPTLPSPPLPSSTLSIPLPLTLPSPAFPPSLLLLPSLPFPPSPSLPPLPPPPALPPPYVVVSDHTPLQVILSRKSEVLSLECELSSVHGLLSRLPDDLNFEPLIQKSSELFVQYPPDVVATKGRLNPRARWVEQVGGARRGHV